MVIGLVKVRKDLTGKRFGRLTIIKQVEDYISPKGNHYSQWFCKCDCGGDTIARGDDLNNKKVISCGCIKSENATIRNKENKKHNIYDLTGEYGIGYTSNTNEPFLFDLEDYNLIKDYTWYRDKRGYIVAVDNKKIIKMHRLIMNFPDLNEVDHKHGEHSKNDNRKSNLRIVTHSNNMMNIGLRKNNKSGVTGVSWDKNLNKWTAYINVDNIRHYLGSFDSFENAKYAREKGEEKYHGEFSYNNSVKEVVL